MQKRLFIILTALITVSIPATVYSLVIDNEDISVGYTAETDKATTDNVAVLVPGQSAQAVQLNYDFATTDSYSQLKKDFSLFNFAPLHVINAKIRFFYRATGLTNTLLFRLTDTNGVQVFRRFSSGIVFDNAWHEITIPITDLQGFGSFDLYKVTQVEIALEKNQGGSGTLDIDKFELIRSSEQIASSQLLDNFDGGTGSPNQFAGPIGTFTNDTNASISTTYDNSAGNVYSGSFSLKLSYNAGTKANADNAGYFNGPNGADLSGYRQIEFYAKASNDNEAFRLRFGSTTVSQNINVGGIGKSWQKVVIPFENFDTLQNAGANLGLAGSSGFFKVTEFVVVFAPGLSAGAGDVWLDDIRFVRPAASVDVVKVVDEMEESADPVLTTWEVAYDVTSFASLSSVTDGVDGRALRMSYSFRSGNFCTMLKKFTVNSTLTDSFRFKYNYSGKANDFEFHVLDSNGTHFVSKMPSLASTAGAWKNMTLPLKTFQSVSGTSLDLRKLKDIRFTLIKNLGGKGTFAVDDLEILNAPKAQATLDGLIQSFTMDNNPFSPNGDGVKDTVTFAYSVKEKCFVRLRIYNTDGSVIKEFKFSDPVPAGSGSITWNGGDNDNARVTNGLYFVQLGAESVETSSRDKATGVVAVLR